MSYVGTFKILSSYFQFKIYNPMSILQVARYLSSNFGFRKWTSWAFQITKLEVLTPFLSKVMAFWRLTIVHRRRKHCPSSSGTKKPVSPRLNIKKHIFEYLNVSKGVFWQMMTSLYTKSRDRNTCTLLVKTPIWAM